MKVKIERDERGPEYVIYNASNPYSLGYVVELPETLFKRYKKVMAEFETVQQLLEKKYKNEG